jgi:hypothetical protein
MNKAAYRGGIRCIQISSSAMSRRDCSRRTASHCFGAAVNAALDLEEHVDTTYSFAGERRLYLSPGRQTSSGRGSSRPLLPLKLVELVVSIKGVGLHEAHIAGKMALRELPGATARVMERCRRWISATERPVVAAIGPNPAEDGFSFASTGTVVSSNGLEHVAHLAIPRRRNVAENVTVEAKLRRQP